MKQFLSALMLVLAVTLIFPEGVNAQARINTPRASPHATVLQTLGMTDISIDYHRPAVRGRTIWGGLVPWDQVWRAGANENTVITFSDDVIVEGNPLAAGRYGLHMIPHENADWDIIFSHQANAWGSFSYDEAEDALRFQVAPEEAPYVDRLSYTFDDPMNTDTDIALNWENLRVYFAVEVEMQDVVVDSLRNQLRGVSRFFWQGWMQAAGWCARNNTNLEEALQWIDRSIGIQQNFTNLSLKGQVLQAMGDTEGQSANLETLEGMLPTATEAEVNAFGYLMVGQGEIDKAIKIFKMNVKNHPDSWNCYDSLGEAYAGKEDKKKARKEYEKALSMVEDETQRARIEGILEGL